MAFIIGAKEFDVITKQVKLLEDWNEKHIEDEPEQVRKNVETIASAIAICYQG